MSNHLPVRCSRSADDSCWEFAWDDDALIAQAKVSTSCLVLSDALVTCSKQLSWHVVAQGGIDEEEHDVLYVGCLSVEVDSHEQEVLV